MNQIIHFQDSDTEIINCEDNNVYSDHMKDKTYYCDIFNEIKIHQIYIEAIK